MPLSGFYFYLKINGDMLSHENFLMESTTKKNRAVFIKFFRVSVKYCDKSGYFYFNLT